MELLWGVNECRCSVKLTVFRRKPVLYRHKAVRHPRLPSLVIVVVTATDKAWILETWAGFFFCFCFVTFSPMMLYSTHSANQWRWLSFQGKRNTFPKPVVTSLPLAFVNLYRLYCSCKAPKYKSLCLLVCDWHLLQLVSQVSPVLPSEEGSPQRPSPLGHHENTVSKNRGLLLSFQLCCSSRYVSLLFALEDTLTDHPHTSAQKLFPPCWEILLIVFCQILPGDCIADL